MTAPLAMRSAPLADALADALPAALTMRAAPLPSRAGMASGPSPCDGMPAGFTHTTYAAFCSRISIASPHLFYDTRKAGKMQPPRGLIFPMCSDII